MPHAALEVHLLDRSSYTTLKGQNDPVKHYDNSANLPSPPQGSGSKRNLFTFQTKRRLVFA
jgi:hypothetical protein